MLAADFMVAGLSLRKTHCKLFCDAGNGGIFRVEMTVIFHFHLNSLLSELEFAGSKLRESSNLSHAANQAW